MLRSLCKGLAALIGATCVILVVVIIVALTIQIGARYLFNYPVHHTDTIAEVGLTWLTFLSVALLYRERGHIMVDLVPNRLSPRPRALLSIVLQVAIVAILVMVAVQMVSLAGNMSRISVGALPHMALTSKFTLILLPVLVGSVLTILFAIERMIDEVNVLAAEKPVEVELLGELE